MQNVPSLKNARTIGERGRAHQQRRFGKARPLYNVEGLEKAAHRHKPHVSQGVEEVALGNDEEQQAADWRNCEQVWRTCNTVSTNGCGARHRSHSSVSG